MDSRCSICVKYCVFVLCLVAFWLNSYAAASWKEGVIYSFQGGTDGQLPWGAIVFDKAGNLYGATSAGGAPSCPPISYCGTVFQLQPPKAKGGAWTEKILHAFAGVTGNNDGATPSGGLVIDTSGNLYGTTSYGGPGNCVLLGVKGGCGTVFEVEPPKNKHGNWAYKILYSFQGGKDGYVPWGDLVLDSKGNLYGATYFGGGKGTTCDSFYQYCGTVFKLSPPKTNGGKWKEQVLYSFKGGSDGANPNGGLVFDSKGSIYGTTTFGGSNSAPCKEPVGVGCGTVFQLKSLGKSGPWTEEILHRFKGDKHDSNSPASGLTWGTDGNLYGATAGGNGGGDDGAIYRLSAPTKGHSQWSETLIHRLTENQGSNSMARPVFDASDQLYGTASLSGKYGGGTVFRATLEQQGATVSVLHAFAGSPDGSYPTAPVTFDRAGNIYTTTQKSGYTGQPCEGEGCGTVVLVTH